MQAVPRLCDFYPGICLTTEEKARKNLSQSKKNLSQVKKNLSQSKVYILPKHPHITKPSQTHTLSNSVSYFCITWCKEHVDLKTATQIQPFLCY